MGRSRRSMAVLSGRNLLICRRHDEYSPKSHPNEGSGVTANMSARAIQAAGMAATGLAGALLMMIPAPQASADTPSYQPALDQLLDAMQQAVANDSALPFATPDSDAKLMTGLQNTNYELLSAGLSRVTELFDGVFFQSPEVVAGDAADSRQYFQFFTPDIYYHATAGLAPGATYELTGTLGKGTEALAIATEAITGSTAVSKESLELDHGLVVSPGRHFHHRHRSHGAKWRSQFHQ